MNLLSFSIEVIGMENISTTDIFGGPLPRASLLRRRGHRWVNVPSSEGIGKGKIKSVIGPASQNGPLNVA